MITRAVVTRSVAWAVVAGCLVLIATMLLFGARVTPYDDLRAAVASGQVDEIRVAGGLDEGHGRGFALAEVHWREHLVPRVSEVYEISGSRGRVTFEEAPRVHGPVDERLLALNPDLRASRSGELGDSTQLGFHVTIGSPPDGGWQLPGWTLVLALAMVVGTLWLLIGGPEPHRATRWAWFWLVGVATPLGTLAFLFLSGATSFRPRPARTEGRLTGGWAFLLSFLIAGALGAFGALVL